MGMKTIIWTGAAEKEMRKVPQDKAATLYDRLERVANGEPLAKPLRKELKDFHSVRAADYRAIIDLKSDHLIVTVIKVDHRRKVYK